MAERPTPYSIAVSITVCTLMDPSSPLYEGLDPSSQVHQRLSSFLQDCVLMDDVPSTSTSSSISGSNNNRQPQQAGWSSIHAMSLTQFLSHLKAIGASDNSSNDVCHCILEVLQMAASSMDSLMDCMESLRRAFVEGIVDETSAHGIFLRKVCLGFDQLSFETSAILWSDLQFEMRAAQEVLNRRDDQSGDTTTATTTPTNNSGADTWNDTTTHWPLSAAQIERALRNQCFRMQDISGDDGNTASAGSGGESFEEMEVKLRKVLDHDPELPAAHFLRFLNCIKHGERVGALDALHQYFDYAIIQSTTSNNKSQDILQFAAILLASLHSSFGDTALAQMATDEAVRVAQQSMDAACVAFALGWIFSNEQGGGTSSGAGGASAMGGMDMSMDAGDLLKRCASRAMEGHLRPLAAGAHLSLTRYHLSGGSAVDGNPVVVGETHASRGLAESAWNSVADATSDRPSVGAADDGAVDRPTHMTDISNSSDVMETLARQQLVSAGIWDYFGMTNLSGISSFLALYCHADKMLSHDVVTAIQNVARVTLYGSSSVLLSQDFSGSVLENYMTANENKSTGPIDIDKETSKPKCIYAQALSKLTSLWTLFRLPMDGVFLLATTLILHEWAIRRGELHQANAFGVVLESYLHPRLSNYWQVMIDVFSQKSLLLSRQGKWAGAKKLINEMIEVAKENDLRTHHASLLLQLSVIQLEANPHLFTGALPPLLECLSMTDKFEMDGLHATASDKEPVGGELAGPEPRVIVGQRLAQLRQATLPGVEGFASAERAAGGLADKRWRRQVAFAGPQRDQPVAAEAMIDCGEDAAIRLLALAAPDAGNKLIGRQ